MNRRRFLVATTVLGTVTTAGCLSTDDTDRSDTNETEDPESNTEDEGPYKSVIRENIQALEEEDLELLKDTLHEESPSYEQTIDEAQDNWSEYELTYEIEELEVTKQPEDETDSEFQSLQMQQKCDCEEQSEMQSLQVQQEQDCEEQGSIQPLQMQQEQNCDPEAHVRFVQTTTSEGNSDFRDNRTEGTHILRESGDDWKIWNSEREDAEYL